MGRILVGTYTLIRKDILYQHNVDLMYAYIIIIMEQRTTYGKINGRSINDLYYNIAKEFTLVKIDHCFDVL